jgi:hypothetical protein
VIHRIPSSLILHLLYCIFYIIVSVNKLFIIFILKHIVHISGHPSSQCTRAGGGGSLEPRTAIAGSFSAWGGLGELDRGLGRGEPFFLIPIVIATRPFKFHANSVSYTSSSFVSSFNSLAYTGSAWHTFHSLSSPRTTCYSVGGFIKGILRGVRCTKSLRVLFLHRRPPSWTKLVLYLRAVHVYNMMAGTGLALNLHLRIL